MAAAQVSFGSQDHQSPQACFAHKAPITIPADRKAHPTLTRVSHILISLPEGIRLDGLSHRYRANKVTAPRRA